MAVEHFITAESARAIIFNVCVGLQQLALPALVLVHIIEELVPDADKLRFAFYWNSVSTARHFTGAKLVPSLPKRAPIKKSRSELKRTVDEILAKSAAAARKCIATAIDDM